ncbi:UNVERIFIED_CONTAM: RNA-binding protein YlmH [Acetivibrio alkalicellulosi]
MKKENLLKTLSKTEDRILLSKVLDKYHLYEKTGKATYSDYLDPYEQKLVERFIKKMGIEDYAFYGGYNGAERRAIVFCPTAMPVDWELNCFNVLKITWSTRDNFSHRDFLGSLMGLGIKREKIGDILVSDEFSTIIVKKEIAQFIELYLSKIGSAKVKVELADDEEIKSFEPKIKDITTTVASLRLDCIASAGFGISRSKISQLVTSQRVNLNWEEVSSASKIINEEDTISIRGKGRIVLQKIGNTTKKNRVHVLIKKFI